MKKSLCVIACVYLLLLTACQGSEGADRAHSQLSAASSASSALKEVPSREESKASTSAPEKPQPQSISMDDRISSDPEPATYSKLSVPVQIVTDFDNPEVYKTTEESSGIAAEENLRFYNEWITKLDAADVTALYGYTVPFDEYTPGEMSLSDSQILFDKLKSVHPTSLLKEEERNNPPTGGGMGLSVQTKDERAVFFFNGGWLIVYWDSLNKGWVFDAQEKSVQDLCYEMMYMLSDNMNNSAGKLPDLLYKNAKAESIYALNTNSYVMARVNGYSLSKDILSELEDYQPNGASPDGLGYLIFTENGKEYVYLDDKNNALTKNCAAALANAPLRPSWLIHMNPDRIISANGITDQDALRALSKALKEEVAVYADTSSKQGPFKAQEGLSTIEIVFDSAISYRIGWLGQDFYVYASDLDTTISYKLENDVPSLDAF